MRLQIALFGRTNTGKSTLLNYITNQSVAITSPIAGTTTDAVEKAMEFAPVGPVLFIDTAGLDDPTELGAERIKKTLKVFDRADIVLLTVLPGTWGDAEEYIVSAARARKIKVIAVITQCDRAVPEADFIECLQKKCNAVICASALDPARREEFISDFRQSLLKNLPENFLTPPPLIGDLVKANDLVVMIVPIDIQAPKGRLILPQVQTIRDALDNHAMTLVLNVEQYTRLIKFLTPRPALIICDSQVVKSVVQATPQDIPCTTFSVLFSRLKGDTKVFLQGCRAISTLQNGDKVLIAEACTHHPTCEDIGRVKLPALLKKFTGKTLDIDFAPGRDYPENISQYKLIIHCGSCMLNRQETMSRIISAQNLNIPITNYGMAISCCQGVLDDVLIP